MMRSWKTWRHCGSIGDLFLQQTIRCHPGQQWQTATALPTCRIRWSSAQPILSSLRTYIIKSGQDLVTGVPSVISQPLSGRFQVQIDQNNTNTIFSPPSCRHKGPERQGQLPSPWSLQEMTDGGCQTKTTMHGQRYFSSWANHSHAITLYITRILFNS